MSARVERAVVAVVLLLAGAVAGVTGTFLHAASAAHVPWGMVLGLAVTFVVCVLGLAVLRARTGAVVVLLGWLAGVLPFGSTRPAGDVVLESSTSAYVWVYGGVLVCGVAVGLGTVLTPRRLLRWFGLDRAA